MLKFMVIHAMQPGSMTREQAIELDQTAQEESSIKGYRSFVNLSEGKAFCIYEAPDRQALTDWLESRKIPYESVTEVEYEGQRGILIEV